jgi:hypothetical protein
MTEVDLDRMAKSLLKELTKPPKTKIGTRTRAHMLQPKWTLRRQGKGLTKQK